MRYEDLRRPRGIERLWLRLRFGASILFPLRHPRADLRHLSDHLLQDMGLERRNDTGGAAVRPVHLEGSTGPAARWTRP